MGPKHTVSTQLADLQENLIAVINAIGSISQQITTLQTDMTTVKHDISGLKHDVSGLKHDVSNFKDSFVQLDRKMDLLTDKVLTGEVKTDKRLRVLETKQVVYHD